MSQENGKADPGPLFVLNGANVMILPRDRIIEQLNKSRLMQAKTDLAAGPVFDNTIEKFRNWSRTADPGWMFHSPEVGLVVTRLATGIPVFTALSDAARKQAEAAEPGTARLKLVTE